MHDRKDLNIRGKQRETGNSFGRQAEVFLFVSVLCCLVLRSYFLKLLGMYADWFRCFYTCALIYEVRYPLMGSNCYAISFLAEGKAWKFDGFKQVEL